MGNQPNKELVSEKDIIILSGIKEITKLFVKEYSFIWHDPHIDSEENKKYLKDLQTICDIKTFTKWEEASDFIERAQTACHVITSGTNGKLLVEKIYDKQQVSSIYVFCGNVNQHKEWTKQFKK